MSENLTFRQEAPLDKHGLIRADILMTDKETGEKLIIEIDGPHHFITEETIRTGDDILNK